MAARRKKKPKGSVPPVVRYVLFVALSSVALGILGYGLRGLYKAWTAPRKLRPGDTVLLLTTGYCNCEICCGWTTNESGVAVYDYGKMKGKPKVVGRTCTGATARPGTIAADPKRFSFGTRLYVPGYGPGRVEDIGGAIKGDHLDLWFPSHDEAKRWGRRLLPVRLLEDDT